MPAETTQSSPNALRRGEVHELRGWQWLGYHPAAMALDLYLATLRVHWIDGARERLLETDRPRLIVAWHNRSLVFPRVVRLLGAERIAVMISASRAAAWESAYYRRRGLVPQRGSTTRGGALALKAAIQWLRAGGDVALSPDGPSGPLYSVRGGAAALARREGVDVLALGIDQPRAHRLDSWDRHLVPWPGQTLEVRVQGLSATQLQAAPDEAAASALVREALLAVNHA